MSAYHDDQNQGTGQRARRITGVLGALALVATLALAGCGGNAHKGTQNGGATQQPSGAYGSNGSGSANGTTGANGSGASSSSGNTSTQLNNADQQMQNALPSIDDTQNGTDTNWSNQYPETQP